MSGNSSYGKLYIVSTPIGNLSDMTFRAVDTLKAVNIIACEDTRHTRELLNHFDIKTKTISCHEHNEYDKKDEIIDVIKNGADVALVSDAGTPIISDPGNVLVTSAIDEGIEVTAVPGACAAINALVLSGLPARDFRFFGFLPTEKKKKEKLFNRLKDETSTMIFYISPHDFLKDMDSLIDEFGEERIACLSREMTKIHEENARGTLLYIKECFVTKKIKGELVLTVSGKDENVVDEEKKENWLSMPLTSHMKYYEEMGYSEKDAMKKVAYDRGIDKGDIYKILKRKE